MTIAWRVDNESGQAEDSERGWRDVKTTDNNQPSMGVAKVWRWARAMASVIPW